MTSSSEVVAAKVALRSAARARRALLNPEERREASAAIAAHGLRFLGRSGAGTIVGGFMPIGEEISPLPLMAAAATSGCRLALPVMMGKTVPLEFRAYTPGEALKTAVWGIREPTDDKPVLAPDVVLVALLAFDAEGYRLGYGGGYYDRTLSALRARKPVITVGLAYDSQEVDAVPHLDYDERLDWMLTPAGPRRTHR